jgi:hypothetical protein
MCDDYDVAEMCEGYEMGMDDLRESIYYLTRALKEAISKLEMFDINVIDLRATIDEHGRDSLV